MSNESMEFELEFTVRDYECDLQGIVNNSVYLNYMEHTRHEYAKSQGNSFLERTLNGEYYVVGRIEVTYRRALKSGDKFVSRMRVEEKGSRKKIFYQELCVIGQERPNATAVVSIYRVDGV